MRERHHSDNDSRATLLPEHSPSPNHLRSSGRVDRTRSIRQAGVKLRNQFLRKGKPKIGILQSLKAIALSSTLNVFLVFVPLAWTMHFNKWRHALAFALCFLAIMPLARLFEYGGHQMMYYCGKGFGELIVVSLNNAVEATLAIILLTKCELKLLQSTMIGVIVLNLLLIPGTAFVSGGARVIHQELHPHLSQLNHSLLTTGVLALLLPAAYFASIRAAGEAGAATSISDATRGIFLQVTHGFAILLLLVYFVSLIYTHNPPGDVELKHENDWAHEGEPEVNQWVCIAMLVITIGLMAFTAEWLVSTIEFIAEEGHVGEEFFGLILLPLISFSADGTVTIIYSIRVAFRHYFGEPRPPTMIAQAQAIDLSIQYILFWMPFIVLLSWFMNKPLLLLFDMFEVAVAVSACFLVNYVTADAKTNWAEGFALVTFYVMIAIISWFYTGQLSIHEMLTCGTVADAIVAASGAGSEH
ncbi:hypothetical protein CPB85DRAFT_1215600 [Mucidula mucida]|nr:hypothetical protein CPB85DRAFT_1215600 [Mucidula mucida]